jgi:hypothetical protein
MTRTGAKAIARSPIRSDVATSILRIRDQPVILDSSLAALYGVTTRRLNEQVRRNPARFPADFVLRLTADETKTVNRSQFATGSQRHRDPRHRPLANTEHGAIMAANVLRSRRAAETSVFVVRAFVQLRRIAEANTGLAAKLAELEWRIEKRLRGHDRAIAETLEAVRQLMRSPAPRRRPLGFTANLDDERQA